MIADTKILLSEAQADVRAADTYTSTKSVDLGVAKGTKIQSRPKLFVQIDAAFVGGKSVQIDMITSDATTLASPDVLVSSPVFTVEEMAAGKMLWTEELPRHIPKRYFGLQYTSVDDDAEAAWEAATAYHLGDLIEGTNAGLVAEIWKCTTAGTSAAVTEPTWDKAAPVPDGAGTLVWTYLKDVINTAGTITAGIVSDTPTGAFF